MVTSKQMRAIFLYMLRLMSLVNKKGLVTLALRS